MGGILTHAELMFVYGVVVFFAGVFLSQRVKDWLKGVPSELRAGLKAAEKLAMDKMKEEAAKIVTAVHASISTPPAPPAPPAPPVPNG